MTAELSRGAQQHPSELPSRRRFLQAGGAAAAGAFGLLQGAPPAAASLPDARPPRGKRPNFLILMVDEMRYPPVYESRALREFRRTQLGTQELLRGTGMEFTRHYAASVACVPSRTSLYTGHYPSLHGVSQTTGAAKAEFDPDVFWLDPSSVPTMGDYFRAAGYQTYWRGKWHGSAADMIVPGTKDGLVTYDDNGVPDPALEAQYLAGNRLDGYGFSGWIGPEPHGQSPLNSGSSAKGARGRDAGFADQARHVIETLDQDHRQSDPWLMMVSFVNPHDITLYGLLLNLGGNFDFHVDPAVPADLFDPALFQQTLHDDLATKPSCQASYQSSYAIWMQPVVDRLTYSRFYYSLHKEVDQRMREVYAALRASRFYEDTIVIFTSDHGDLHQKWYTMYDEALRIPLVISNPRLFPRPQTTSALTSHVDLLPTMLGLAGLDAEGLRKELAKDHTDAVPLVGRNLAGLVTGKVNPAKVREPLYFMTDDDASRGLNQNNWTGIAYASVTQPNHIEAVIAQLDDGTVWKYARYFDSAQFWSTPGTPGDTQVNVEDVVLQEVGNPPDTDGTSVVPFKRTVKHTPLPDQLEMYNVSDDPMELANLAGRPAYAKQEKVLAALLREQCAKKRLTPVSGQVPGQPTCQR